MDIAIPIILTNEDSVYYVGIPDITEDNYSTYGNNIEEATKNALDVAVLYLADFLENGKELPKIKNIDELIKNKKENEIISMLYFNLDFELAKVRNNLKNKTVVLPVWLDMLAKEKGLNFSQVLQRALKEELRLI